MLNRKKMRGRPVGMLSMNLGLVMKETRQRKQLRTKRT
jgi:hypothetical protein